MMNSITKESINISTAKFMLMEQQLIKQQLEIERLSKLSLQHSNTLKECQNTCATSVNQIELMSALTTNRFQSVNEMKQLKESLILLFTSGNKNLVNINTDNINFNNINSNNMDHSNIKAMTEDIKNEMFNSNFKTNLDMRKLENELRTTQKDLLQAKIYITHLESNLSDFIDDVQRIGGIKSTVDLKDLPKLNLGKLYLIIIV